MGTSWVKPCGSQVATVASFSGHSINSAAGGKSTSLLETEFHPNTIHVLRKVCWVVEGSTQLPADLARQPGCGHGAPVLFLEAAQNQVHHASEKQTAKSLWTSLHQTQD